MSCQGVGTASTAPANLADDVNGPARLCNPTSGSGSNANDIDEAEVGGNEGIGNKNSLSQRGHADLSYPEFSQNREGTTPQHEGMDDAAVSSQGQVDCQQRIPSDGTRKLSDSEELTFGHLNDLYEIGASDGNSELIGYTGRQLPETEGSQEAVGPDDDDNSTIPALSEVRDSAGNDETFGETSSKLRRNVSHHSSEYGNAATRVEEDNERNPSIETSSSRNIYSAASGRSPTHSTRAGTGEGPSSLGRNTFYPPPRPSYTNETMLQGRPTSTGPFDRVEEQRTTRDSYGTTLASDQIYFPSNLDGPTSSSPRNISPPVSHTIPSQTHADVVVPRWQPDAEVTYCPICRTQFSFFVRKHHCRKCGRVVCNACSPHRITIPYQFIVQPPTDGVSPTTPRSQIRPPVGPASTNNSEFASLGGGERVRLCNPCVPDPNVTPPQTNQFTEIPIRPPRSSHHGRSISSAAASYNLSPHPQGSPNSQSRFFENPRLQVQEIQRRRRESGIMTEDSSRRLNAANRNSTHEAFLRWYGAGPSGSLTLNDASRSRSSTVSGSARDSSADLRNSFSRPVGSSGSPSQNSPIASQNLQPHYRSLVPRDETFQARPLPRIQRVAEEDECPICHRELPSSTIPDSDALRATHISDCIESALRSGTSSPQPRSTTSAITPADNTPAAASPVTTNPTPAASSSSTIIPNTPEGRTAAREQAHAAVVFARSQSPNQGQIRRTGVFPYKATEKDCVDDAECTICMEEYEVGVDMGRLECFCRFHLGCIRMWFVDHPGQCPVHQHDGGY